MSEERKLEESAVIENNTVADSMKAVDIVFASFDTATTSVDNASTAVAQALAKVEYYCEKIQRLYEKMKDFESQSTFSEDDLRYIRLKNRYNQANESYNQANESYNQASDKSKQAYDHLVKARKILDKLNTRKSDKIVITEVNERLDTIVDLLANVQDDGSLFQYSETTIGAKELKRLTDTDLVFEAEILKDEDPFLSQKEQHEVNCIKNEIELIAYLTPFFDAVLKNCDMVFVNSENTEWLPQSSKTRSNFKPDGFSTHPGMFVKKDDHGATGRLYGEAVKELLDCVILFQGKVKINNTAFGQVARYLKQFNPNESGSVILFDRTSFWMITSSRGRIVKVVKSMWVNEGSKTLFQNFIIKNKPSWISCLQISCDFFNVVVKEGNSFLGCGAFGRVFRVFRDEEEFALKISERSFAYRLCQEWAALKNAERTNLTIIPEGPYFEFPNGAAILLSPVGRSLTKPKEKEDVVKLFAFLHQLHLQGLVHGDPCIPNVILHGNQLLWIDLVDMFDVSVLKSSHLLYKDISTLTRSILSKSHNANLGELECLLKKYSEDASKENLDAVVDKVCKILIYD